MEFDIKQEIINKLSPTTYYERFGWDNPRYAELEEPVRKVMTAYQNANRWLDTIKEHILINLNLPYFSEIVHQLAHTMPVRFDKFGDILHTENLEVPYPSTEEWSRSLGNYPQDCIKHIYTILDAIKDSLVEFREAVHPVSPAMSIACDELIVDICKEYEFFIRAEKSVTYYASNLDLWDQKFCNVKED